MTKIQPPTSLGFKPSTHYLPASPAVNCSDFAATVQPSFVILPMQDKTEGEFLQRLRTSPPGLSRI